MPTQKEPIVKLIPIGSIDDPEWNSRLDVVADSAALKELAASMDSPTGQINPVSVEAVGERYLLVAGSRRLAAARLLDWKEIKAEVFPATDRVRRIAANVVENMLRFDLSLYEQARAVTQLKREGQKISEITSLTGFSKGKISKLVSMFEKLPPEVIEQWKNGHEVATFDFLYAVAITEDKDDELTPVAQMAAWHDRVKLTERFEEKLNPPPPDRTKGKKGKKSDESDKPYRVTQQRFFDIATAIKKTRVAGGTLAINAMRALVGETDELKGVWKLGEDDDDSED